MPAHKLYHTIEDWLLAKATVSGVGCWVPNFNCRTDPGGYPYAWFDGKNRRVVTMVWDRLVGPLPRGMQRDHRCKNRLCFNPDHLEPVTGKENNARSGSPTAINGRKTHCVWNHPFTPENTYFRRTGGRRCRTCMKHQDKKAKEKKRLKTLSRKKMI